MPKKGFLRAGVSWIAILMLLACAGPAVTPGEPAATPVVGTKLPYQDATLPVEARVEDLISRMTLEEKIGQMAQVERFSIRERDITDLFLGSLLSGGGGYPAENTAQGWAEMVDGYQAYALKTRLGIPLIYGVDAIHGHAAVGGAVVFPQNIGLGAARDPDLVERIGRVTAREMAATGVYWNFGPVVAVPQDIRWGRTYEGYSEDTALVCTLAGAYIRGLQNPDLGDAATVLATAKHYVGDGGTVWGTSETYNQRKYMIDQGVTAVDEATLRAIHLPPYVAAIEAGARSIMVSFSSWGGLKMHAQKYLLTDVLKGELGFDGVLVSDWAGIDQIPGDYYSDIVTSINAGLDMVMVPYDYRAFTEGLRKAVETGDVPVERVDDAVRRILTVKFELGLFERPFAEASLLPSVGSDEHRQLAREAVRKSLVLLKNDGMVLPLAKDTPLILVAGKAADDIGIQCGGWTIEWQGKTGDITAGTTILQAIEDSVTEGTTVRFDPSGEFEGLIDGEGDPLVADVGIVVVGEEPYAEGWGDRADLALEESDVAVIERVRAKCENVVVVLISGRPMIVTEQLDDWDAFVAAWLPGTEGRGVADVLFGDYPFSGKLPYTWPRSMDQVPLDRAGEDPLFPFGFGLEADTSAP